MRTYHPLVVGVYFRPIGVYLLYYSYYYHLTYYDGYGWNFYTQAGGYYDGKAHPDDCYDCGSGKSSVGTIIAIIVVIVCCCCIIGYVFSRNAGEEEEEVTYTTTTVVKEEVIEDHNSDGYGDSNPYGTAYPPGQGPNSAPPAYPPGMGPPGHDMGAPPAYPPGMGPPAYPPAGQPGMADYGAAGMQPAGYGQQPPAYPMMN